MVNLTLVDLPGIIHNGEELEIQRIKNMIEKYISSKLTLILVVRTAD